MIDWEELLNSAVSWATGTGLRILIALVILYLSFKLINYLARKMERRSNTIQKLDKTLTHTLIYVCKILAKGLAVICMVGYLGIDTSGLTALVTSLGVCAGLAVNGTLSNLAGGVLLLVTRPFKIDDYVEIAGQSGTVEDIRIVTTKLVTPDNRVIYIPNSTASTSCIVNYSEKGLRRIDLTFSVSYSSDFKKAEEIIGNILTSHGSILKTPEPVVRVVSQSASSIDICCRPWVNSADYWDVYFDVTEQVKACFDKEGIEIPFDQLDVHISQSGGKQAQ